MTHNAASMSTTETNYNSIPTTEENKGKRNFSKWKQTALKRQNLKKIYPVQHIQPIPTVNSQYSVLDN